MNIDVEGCTEAKQYTSSISTTIYILLKTHTKERKVTKCLAPNIPTHNLGGHGTGPAALCALQLTPRQTRLLLCPRTRPRLLQTRERLWHQCLLFKLYCTPTPTPIAAPSAARTTNVQNNIVPLRALHLRDYPDGITITRLM